jgi:hypothetical protein
MKRAPTSRALIEETEDDFSLVLGGPLYKLWRRMHAAGPTLGDSSCDHRPGQHFPWMAWLPLLVLTVYEGVPPIGRTVPVPFLYDLDRPVPGSW